MAEEPEEQETETTEETEVYDERVYKLTVNMYDCKIETMKVYVTGKPYQPPPPPGAGGNP